MENNLIARRAKKHYAGLFTMNIALQRLVKAAFLPVILCLMHPVVLAQESQPRILTAVAEVRNLTAAQARRHYPVKLRGVVTFYGAALFSRFIQDETAGIYLNETNVPILVAGQLVEVEGFTSPGEYAPIVMPEQVRIIGTTELPAPRAVTFEQLASGKEDSQFVEVAGVVRSVHFDETSKYYLIELATGGGRLTVYAPDLPAAAAKSGGRHGQDSGRLFLGIQPAEAIVCHPAHGAAGGRCGGGKSRPGKSVQHSDAKPDQLVPIYAARHLRTSRQNQRRGHLF